MPKQTHIHDVLHARVLARAGLTPPPARALSAQEIYDSLQQSEWSPAFERLMRNRLMMGALRYGKLHGAGKPQYDRIESIFKRLKQYRLTGNMELLVDAANLCLLEFEEGKHPTRHFASSDDGEHVATK